MSEYADKTYFKGGTSLSKYIVSHNSDIYKEELSETGGNYRKLYFSYDNVFQSIGLKDHLEVEIKSCDLPDKRLMFYPADIRVIKPIVTDFLENTRSGRINKHLRTGKL